MKKNKNPWDQIDPRDVTPEDQVRYKKLAVKETRSKKIKSILFASLSAVGIATVLGIAFGIPKPINNMVIWKKETNILKKSEFVDYLKQIEPIEYHYDGKPIDFAKEVLINPTLDNPVFKPFNLDLKDNVKEIYNTEIKNVIINGIDGNSICLDILLRNKKSTKDFIVLPKIVLRGFQVDEQTKNFITEEEASKLVQDVKFNFIGKGITIEKAIEEINKPDIWNSWYDRETVFQSYFEPQNLDLQGFLPFYFTSKLKYENYALSFDCKAYKLGIFDIKLKGKTYRYGQYISNDKVIHHSSKVVPKTEI
ncbi:hypothetical protein [[Mycoplasma] anseris]|uniref:Uncharacterized protein n=1 Tax=[Mycoplasma] anseris TaxID=92400 RepID=A0A2Z4NDL0_9BACT|nr:hypothetical protein [[Mycoplasma] anseris]AWX69495.1 hypothetical protein DP065_01880 [[Mycoplasma] anseris]